VLAANQLGRPPHRQTCGFARVLQLWLVARGQVQVTPEPGFVSVGIPAAMHDLHGRSKSWRVFKCLRDVLVHYTAVPQSTHMPRFEQYQSQLQIPGSCPGMSCALYGMVT
jgi:hypothetical protein